MASTVQLEFMVLGWSSMLLRYGQRDIHVPFPWGGVDFAFALWQCVPLKSALAGSAAANDPL
jgi:hypothetical protein